ncbi:MAG TPA: hypothetical protein VEB65_10260 [Solirubrobacterales bacterium]|nr:hypothetical protein [Solirubrobacterales bacterium]
MFYCERCRIRFSVGALSGETECPRCRMRDGVSQPLRAEPLRPIERMAPWRPFDRAGTPDRAVRH